MGKPNTRCGRIAFFGRPNAGKSSLVNRILGQELCIVTRKAQTTRDVILGVRNIDGHQLVLVDTPGLHRHQKRSLGAALNRSAKQALDTVDVRCFVVDASAKWNQHDQWALDQLKQTALDAPCILLLNKIDQLSSLDALLPIIDRLSKLTDFAAVCPVSAKSGEKLNILLSTLCELIPKGAFEFPARTLTNRSQHFLIAELIRKQIYLFCNQELPYSCAVQVEKLERVSEPKPLTTISASIWVERDSQKGVVIGKRGQRLQKIGKGARIAIASLLGEKIYLALHVKLKKDWPDDPTALEQILGRSF